MCAAPYAKATITTYGVSLRTLLEYLEHEKIEPNVRMVRRGEPEGFVAELLGVQKPPPSPVSSADPGLFQVARPSGDPSERPLGENEGSVPLRDAA